MHLNFYTLQVRVLDNVKWTVQEKEIWIFMQCNNQNESKWLRNLRDLEFGFSWKHVMSTLKVLTTNSVMIFSYKPSYRITDSLTFRPVLSVLGQEFLKKKFSRSLKFFFHQRNCQKNWAILQNFNKTSWSLSRLK